MHLHGNCDDMAFDPEDNKSSFEEIFDILKPEPSQSPKQHFSKNLIKHTLPSIKDNLFKCIYRMPLSQ